MKKASLSIETRSNGKKVYSVHYDGALLYKSAPTHRDYVAILGHGDFADYRFGRVDLIGKGDSRHIFNSSHEVQKDFWLAQL